MDMRLSIKIVYDIYSSVILRDTVQRHNIRNVELLERVVKFVFDNIGNKLNAKNIADYFKSQQRRVDMNTIYNYLNALESAFIIQRIPRYDIKGKAYIETPKKSERTRGRNQNPEWRLRSGTSFMMTTGSL